ncbi:MAG: 3-isopropylmalate dehydrogenase [Clostridiales bacterium]|nr:3-isopropylmalate dehydrogenase [Clostridiales bacterium]
MALIPGDGIGPEIIDAARRVLEKAAAKFGISFAFTEVMAGGCAIDAHGVPLPEGALDACLASGSVLLGAVGGPRWETLPGHLRPERALLGIRKGMGLFANLRPARLMPMLKDACPLRAETAERGFDMLIVRELTGGMYFGESGRRDGPDGPEAFDTECYSVKEIRRIGRIAFEAARTRRKEVTSIDKANVLESSRLWRETIHDLAREYPDVAYRDMLVDNAAMQLVQNPAQFDVIVTSNIFGDILSDEASQLTGSIGLLPSASLGDGTRGLYEPIHGSAPDIAGKDMANPIATVLSAAMMLRMSFGLHAVADLMEKAVDSVLEAGLRTRDIARGGPYIKGSEMANALLDRI